MKKDTVKIMGILNVTPNSFSDGGIFNTLQKAVAQAKKMEKEGADIIDIGGESTGPGSKPVTLKEELERVIPVIKAVKKHTKLRISVDTYKPQVAQKALEAGADMINDVTALRYGKEKMAKVIAKSGCQIVMMYSKDKAPHATVKEKKYKDVIKTIEDFFDTQLKFAKKHGIKRSQIIIDPGMGQFISAIPEYSYEIIIRLVELEKIGLPILVGISRKSFLGGEIEDRDKKGPLIETIAYINGASIIRTHNVKNSNTCLKCN